MDDGRRCRSRTSPNKALLRPIEAEDFGCAIVVFRGAVGIIEGTADVYPKLKRNLEHLCEKGTVVIGTLR